MGGLSKVMFSEVQGTVVKDGKPVAGVKVLREYTWHWDDKKVTDQTTTDSNGKFSFPAVTKFSMFSSVLPHEPVIGQEIRLTHEGQEYLAWRYYKREYENNGELKGKKISLDCELTRKVGYYINDDIYGICKLN